MSRGGPRPAPQRAPTGDGSPGAQRVRGGRRSSSSTPELGAREYAYMRPAIEDGPAPGSKELRVTDPFGNRIAFLQRGGGEIKTPSRASRESTSYIYPSQANREGMYIFVTW
ncbi:hypothetical protein LLEC1_04969 [Akanthomyces lecanii]|uniref:Uncharacterized protein n=1 Tax=Cordyceps confragosa TaxID=2714763 RepID=A0A179I6P4_CORDF|nr:hypothetical protein LLEC1_04969 [Akanthomyces lecanii]